MYFAPVYSRYVDQNSPVTFNAYEKSQNNTAQKKQDWENMRRSMGILRGLVYGGIDIEAFMRSQLGTNNPMVTFALYGATNQSPSTARDQLLFDNRQKNRTAASPSLFRESSNVSFDGRTLHFELEPGPAFASTLNRRSLLLAAAFGVATTCLLAGFIAYQTKARLKVESTSASLRKSEAQLQATLSERQRISRDLHDSVLQSLYAGVLNARIIARHLEADPAAAKAGLEQHVAHLEEAMRETRSFLTGGNGKAMSVQEVAATLRTFTDLYNRQGEHCLEFAASGKLSGTLPASAAEHLLPITRESVSNAIRHGQAKQINLSISVDHGFMRLEIQDDGAGFDPVSARQSNHGLDNMATRAASFGGRFHIESQPGGPTVVTADFPLVQGVE